MKKNLLTILTFAIISGSLLTGCGCSADISSTPDTATKVVSTVPTEATVETLSETDQAIVDSGLSVDENGNIVDKDGEKVETTDDGKIKVKTDNGTEIEVSTENIKTAKNNEKKVEEAKISSNSNNSSSSKNNNSSSNNSSSSKSNNSSSKTNNSSSSKSSNSNSNSNKSSNTSSNSNSSSKNNSSSSKSDSGSSSGKTDEHAGKTYHEAVYKTVEHPAEYETVTVVDQEAYSYEEPVYEYKNRVICTNCGADITDLPNNGKAHRSNHLQNGESSGYRIENVEVQTGTRTIAVPEKSHTEQKLIKEAWTEKVLVKEAGWY